MVERKAELEMKELLKRIYGCSKDRDLDRSEKRSSRKTR
jgi:hypothetical protein